MIRFRRDRKCVCLGPGIDLNQVPPIAVIAALLMTSVAQAATVANRDDRDIKFTVIEGPTREDRTLSPGKVIEGICQKGCIIRLNDKASDEYEFEGSDHVYVEGGFLYYDGPAADGAPLTGRPHSDKP